jgi:transcription initiation factor TFIID subunit TAF12
MLALNRKEMMTGIYMWNCGVATVHKELRKCKTVKAVVCDQQQQQQEQENQEEGKSYKILRYKFLSHIFS